MYDYEKQNKRFEKKCVYFGIVFNLYSLFVLYFGFLGSPYSLFIGVVYFVYLQIFSNLFLSKVLKFKCRYNFFDKYNLDDTFIWTSLIMSNILLCMSVYITFHIVCSYLFLIALYSIVIHFYLATFTLSNAYLYE